ncbi:unnamed protein product [Closterium sp. NIES-54]
MAALHLPRCSLHRYMGAPWIHRYVPNTKLFAHFPFYSFQFNFATSVRHAAHSFVDESHVTYSFPQPPSPCPIRRYAAVFAFIVTNQTVADAVSNKGVRSWKTTDFSTWLQNQVTEQSKWAPIQACLAAGNTCSVLSQTNTTASSTLSSIQVP